MSDRNEEDKLAERRLEWDEAERDSAEAEVTDAASDAEAAEAASEADRAETVSEAEAARQAAEDRPLEQQPTDHAIAEGGEQNKPREGGASIGKWLWPAATAVLAVALVVTLVWNKPDAAQSGVAAEAEGVTVTQQELYDELILQMGEAQVGSIVDEIITTRLIGIEADKAGFTQNQADIDEELNGIKANFPSDEAFEQALAQNYMTLESLTEQIVVQLQIEHIFSDKVAADEATLRQYYTDNESSFGTPEQIRASHILLPTEEEAQEVLAELNAGADFATLAGEKSTDPGSSASGGDLNFFPRGVMHAEFEEAAFALQPGEMSGVVQSPSGYHIILATDHQQAELKSFEELQEEVRDQYVNEQMYTLFSPWLEEVRQAANIKNPFQAQQ